jgi:N-acetylneuraminic acid mutarotase
MKFALRTIRTLVVVAGAEAGMDPCRPVRGNQQRRPPTPDLLATVLLTVAMCWPAAASCAVPPVQEFDITAARKDALTTVVDSLPTAGLETAEIDAMVRCRAVLADLEWSYRIWPETNPEPKPARTSVQPDSALRQQIDDALRMETALRTLYGVELDAKALQIELNRMAVNSRQPERLRAIHAALGNDAEAVANCVARPVLADRRLREGFANDERWHGELRRRAETALESGGTAASMKSSGGLEQTLTLVLDDDDGRSSRESGMDLGELRLSAEDFESERARLLPLDASPPDSEVSRPRTQTGLRETADTFVEETVLLASSDRIEVRSRTWAKQPFDSWWSLSKDNFEPAVAWKETAQVQLPQVDGKAMAAPKAAADSWHVFDVPTVRTGHTAVWTGSEMIVWGGYLNSEGLSTGGRYDPATDSWKATTMHGAPSPRIDHTAVWTGSEMIVWGGYSISNPLATGGRYNPASDSWTPTSTSAVASARTGHVAVWTGNEMIVWGGSDSTSSSTGGRYDPAADSWTTTSTNNAPDARSDAVAVWTGSEMIVWGGYSSSEVATGGRYDPLTDSWVATSMSGAPSARYRSAAVWTGSEMIVWGGGPGVGNTGGRYDPVVDSWSPTALSGAPVARENHTASWTGSEMIVWGGSSSTDRLATGSRYNPTTDSWTATTTSGAPSARTAHTAIWSGNEMIVWGGTLPTDAGGRYDPASNSWTATATTGTPSARHSHTALWTGSEMIVWGGNSGSVGVATGGRYQPAIDAWTATSTNAAPGARYDHSMVWTGSEMIVWGGTGSANVNTGARYNPATDSWMVTTTSGAPSARNSHTAIWAAGEMIVWGGFPWTRAGGRYDPVLDNWTATSLIGAPTGRDDHTSIWTGSEMIVWGGIPSDNIAGRYNPTTDAWTSASAIGAPDSHYMHTAVWTGSEMIVWGGRPAAGNASGRYNPMTDSWSPISTSNAPGIARESHTAVWTGSEMIVWGGRDFSWPGFFTGGRFDPATNTWTATSNTGVPRARYNHTAVWTGTEMILFGGLGSCCAFAELAIYYPHFIAEASTSTITSDLPDPSSAGQAVTIAVSVRGARVRPVDGTVTVTASSGESCSTVSPISGGIDIALFSCDLSFNTVGPRTLTAAFGNSATHANSTSAAEPHSVTTTLTVSPTSLPPGTFGIAYSATLTAAGAGSSNPYAFAVTEGSVPTGLDLSSNGELSGAPSATGTFDFTVTASDSSSMGVGGPFTGSRAYSLVLGPASQTIAFGNAPNVEVGTTGLLSATGGTSGNPIVFTTQTSNVCTLSGATVTGIATGTCTIAANQAGNANYLAAPEVTQSFAVGSAVSAIVVGSSANPANAGDSVTFTATVVGQAPSGSVEFVADTLVVAGCGAQSLSGNGPATATCTTDQLAAGTRAISAHYSGDANNTAASSAALIQSINALPTIDAPTIASVLEDGSTMIDITLADGETAAGELQLVVASSNGALITDAALAAGLGGSGASRTLTMTPLANASGSATLTLTATDGNSATTSRALALSVLPVNDAPQASYGSDRLHAPGTNGMQTITGFATGISAGPNESAQAVSFETVVVRNAWDLVSAAALDADGTLRYTLNEDVTLGAAEIEVTAVDDGGSQNGGIDRGTTRRVRILVGGDDIIDLVVQLERTVPAGVAGANAMAKGAAQNFLMTVRNNGPIDAVDARIAMSRQLGLLDVLWSCVAPAACRPVNGSGAVDAQFDLAVGQTLSLEMSGTLDASQPFVDLLVQVHAPAGIVAVFADDDYDTFIEQAGQAGLFKDGFER